MNRRVLASLLGLGALALAVLPASTGHVAATSNTNAATNASVASQRAGDSGARVVADSPIVDSPNAVDARQNASRSVPAAPSLSGPSAVGDLASSSFDRMPAWSAPAGYEGSWSATSGRLQQTGDASGDGSLSHDTAALANNVATRDGTVRVVAYPTGGEPFGVLFRGTASGHYRVTLYPNAPNNGPKAVVERVSTASKSGTRVSSVVQASASAWQGYTPGRWHDVRLAMQGSRVELFVDGANVLSYTDTAPAAGWSGLWGTADQGVSFDNFALSSAADFTVGEAPSYEAPASNDAPAAPLAGWSSPKNVTNSPLYDQTPALAVSASTGAVTVLWMRDDPQNVTTPASYLMASNGSASTDFSNLTVSTALPRALGNIRAARDSEGKVHAAFFELTLYSCGRYSQLDAKGNAVLTEDVPGTCGTNRKNVAIAVGPTGTVHILFGSNNRDAYYYQRSADGKWTVQGEEVVTDAVADLAIVESTKGVVMAAYKAPSLGGYSDIVTARRDAAGTWVKENVSSQCCNSCADNSRTYLPSLAAAPDGGLRMSWSDESCEARGELAYNDIYYREWVPGTGWEGKPMVRVVKNAGHSYYNDIAVDSSGKAHIIWADTTGREYSNFLLMYASGSGTTFSAPVSPWDAWNGVSFSKEPSIETSTGYAHVVFGSNRDDFLKENYYTNLPITDGPTPTPQPTATPVACLFTDVCTTDYFYDAVRALNKAGVLSGYAANPPCDKGTPCFRPYDNMTRAQSVKVVALGAGWRLLEPRTNSFADVAVGSTFYQYVETAAARGVISGYQCGGANEPCDSEKRPYLRPGGKVTRGQFTKMVVSGFDMQLHPGNTAHFADVPVGSTFFQYIETAYTGGLISGYGDGNFRPNDNVTRGQAAKVVYIARGNK
ncbi:MAG TPA: S-layer homology domain-containing protein [Chloroflexia bacterium]|nr:S-layer homology domain-containing protein [Chloroflexia bacterium]